MQPSEQRAMLAIALAAAFADGNQSDPERNELRRVTEALQLGGDFNLPALVQDVVLRRIDLEAQAEQLSTTQLRQLAFEFAVGVCDADGLRNESETRFLAELGRSLGLTQPQIAGPAAAADAIATVALAPAAEEKTSVDGEAMDKLILDSAITCGALELLPHTVATMAVLALQMRMVYRIGAAHGYELERGHVKDFLAAAGVSLTGQYLEQIGRGIVGGLFGAAAGNLVGAIARGATGATFSFATTYALGHVAREYYAGGRVMSTAMLQQAYTTMLAQAKTLQARYQGEIAQRVGSIDARRLAGLVRGH
jgi:uncharacterized protein (DUF697 family)/tellurite resistance protein